MSLVLKSFIKNRLTVEDIEDCKMNHLRPGVYSCSLRCVNQCPYTRILQCTKFF